MSWCQDCGQYDAHHPNCPGYDEPVDTGELEDIEHERERDER